MTTEAALPSSLLLPQRIAGDMQADELPVRVRVGHLRPQLLADQAALVRVRADRDLRHPRGLARLDLLSGRQHAWQDARGDQLADPGAEVGVSQRDTPSCSNLAPFTGMRNEAGGRTLFA